MRVVRASAGFLGLVLQFVNAGAVHAELVELPQTVVVAGEQLDVFEVLFEHNGRVEVEVADLEVLNGPLSALSFAVFDTGGPVTDVVQGSGTLEFFYTGEFAAIQIYSEAVDYGAYRVDAQLVVVPLPPAILFLASAIGILLTRMRRNTF